MAKNVTFDQAVQDESLRQQWLDQFLKKHSSPFVSKIWYNPNEQGYREWCKRAYKNNNITHDLMKDIIVSIWWKINQPDLLAFVPSCAIYARMPQIPIFINPLAFERLTEKGMESSLEDHEYVHAETLSKGHLRLGEEFKIAELPTSTTRHALEAEAFQIQARVHYHKGMPKILRYQPGIKTQELLEQSWKECANWLREKYNNPKNKLEQRLQSAYL